METEKKLAAINLEIGNEEYFPKTPVRPASSNGMSYFVHYFNKFEEPISWNTSESCSNIISLHKLDFEGLAPLLLRYIL